MKLIDPTDDALNEAFAEKVAGVVKHKDSFGLPRWGAATLPAAFNLLSLPHSPPSYTTSADAVLPFVIKQNVAEKWAAEIYIGAGACSVYFKKANAEADTLPRAAVIALLRAHGVEIEFTKATP